MFFPSDLTLHTPVMPEKENEDIQCSVFLYGKFIIYVSLMKCKSFKWQVRLKVRLSPHMPRINADVSLSISERKKTII